MKTKRVYLYIDIYLNREGDACDGNVMNATMDAIMDADNKYCCRLVTFGHSFPYPSSCPDQTLVSYDQPLLLGLVYLRAVGRYEKGKIRVHTRAV